MDEKAFLNPSKSLLALKRSTLGICRLLKGRSLKKIGKTPSSHIIHSLGGEYCWMVQDSEPIILLKSLRSLSTYILNNNVWFNATTWKFQDEPNLRNGQNFQFYRYAYFSKLMRTFNFLLSKFSATGWIRLLSISEVFDYCYHSDIDFT